tara:strand:+ start:105 stop:332 length:228 start_codon:yes stop_codon:yes gene_type:complete
MYISEVRNSVKRERGNFIHRREFETLSEGLEWARELAGRIVEGGFWTDEEIEMEHCVIISYENTSETYRLTERMI